MIQLILWNMSIGLLCFMLDSCESQTVTKHSNTRDSRKLGSASTGDHVIHTSWGLHHLTISVGILNVCDCAYVCASWWWLWCWWGVGGGAVVLKCWIDLTNYNVSSLHLHSQLRKVCCGIWCFATVCFVWCRGFDTCSCMAVQFYNPGFKPFFDL